MDTLIVRDFDTAIDVYIESWKRGFSWDRVKFSEKTALTIKLKGDQWDGALDYKVAEFVIRLQKALVAAYNEQSPQKVKYNTRPMDDAGLRVTVSVEPGCSVIKAALKGMWDNMESKDKRTAIIAVAAILSVAAGVAYWHKCDTDAKIAKISADSALERAREEKKAEIELKIQERLHDESVRREAMHAIDRAFDLAEQATAPVAFLASKMQPEDQMTVNSVPIPSGTAKRLFRQKIHEEELGEEVRFFIDGDYVITAINRKKHQASIKFADKERVFSLVWLDEDDKQRERFYQACSQYKKDKPLPASALQLTAYFRGGVFQHGFVQGIGPKRKGAKTFTEAALASASMEEDREKAEGEN